MVYLNYHANNLKLLDQMKFKNHYFYKMGYHTFINSVFYFLQKHQDFKEGLFEL